MQLQTLELTPSHTGLIAENVDITLTCVTDESNPTANIVWTSDGEIVNIGITVSEMSGQYKVKKRSVLTLTTEKSLNGVQYKCHVEGQDDVSDQSVVQVLRIYESLSITKCNSIPMYLCTL